MDINSEGIGDQFQEQTKYHRPNMPFSIPGWSRRPEGYETSPQGAEIVKLPDPANYDAHPLWSVIARRRSRRDFTNDPLTLSQLSQLIWATQGTTLQLGAIALRAAPSAGALYPIETYLTINRVETLPPGVYHYNPIDIVLEKLNEGKHCGSELAAAALHQDMVSDAAATFVWTAVIPRTKRKYRQRCYRYIYLDAGHIGENLYLAAEAMGLGCCTVGAFFDEEVNRIIGVDGSQETVIYLGVVGHVC